MFSHLLKHELKWRFKNNSNNRRGIIFVYFAVLIIIGLYFWTRAALAGNIEPSLNWNILVGLPFAMLAMSAGSINREWKSNTVGWWLSLPYSRLTLVMAKFLAGLYRALIIFLAVAILVILAYLYAMIFDPHLTFQGFDQFLIIGANMGMVLVVITPLVVSLGMLTAVFARTGYRYFVPLMWIIFWGLWSFAISSYFSHVFGKLNGHYFSLFTPSLIALVPCWLLTFGFLYFIANSLEKKLFM